ncbi:MAG: RNA 2',3'-cyclic phosphodiesterase [Aeropyrum sp.]|nr:RNA 2',3'-cyclic phosphodiesterase [Aeropyrum sp.]MCE4616341.1 RNA 2',3'-cyclic phosphodiesterase [Aeropyrum sp.]
MVVVDPGSWEVLVPRVFIAVDIDDPVIVGRLASIRDTVAQSGVPMKVVETENFHITLRFIGEVDDRAVESIKEALARIEFEEFDIEIRGVGAFPAPERPRVVWVGVGRGGDRLGVIRSQVEGSLRSMGFRPERQEFHPHITIARIKGSRGLPALVRMIRDMADVEVGVFRVRSIRLKKSTLTRSGPIYETLAEVRPLGRR